MGRRFRVPGLGFLSSGATGLVRFRGFDLGASVSNHQPSGQTLTKWLAPPKNGYLRLPRTAKPKDNAVGFGSQGLTGKGASE